MNSAEVICSINDIYERLAINKNLQLHMQRVAAVAEMICDNFTVQVNKDSVVAACLVHDVGNIVKFDFNNTALTAKLLESSGEDPEFYAKLQESTIKKYGSDPESVTMKLLKEQEVDGRILSLIETIGYTKAEIVQRSPDLEAKICYYADKRVGPFGVISLEQRLEEGSNRYKSRPGFVINNKLDDSSRAIEKQIAEKLSITVDKITDKAIEPYIQKYKQRVRTN